jgi:uracil-DNA glycosylase family 4
VARSDAPEPTSSRPTSLPQRPGTVGAGAETADAFAALADEVVSCRRCPRLVAHREAVAERRRAAFADEAYWGRPVPGFGDPAAKIVVVGLAPAAHGANRTGRIFTGDRSGDWLYAALWRAGLANQPTSRSADDGLVLRDTWVTAAVRCAPPGNRPTPDERDRCRPFLGRELALLDQARVVVALGGFAYQVVAAEVGLRPRPRFGHGVVAAIRMGATTPAGSVAAPLRSSAANLRAVVCSYHPSQQNTFTGRLTEPMLDQVVATAVALAGVGTSTGTQPGRRAPARDGAAGG